MSGAHALRAIGIFLRRPLGQRLEDEPGRLPRPHIRGRPDRQDALAVPSAGAEHVVGALLLDDDGIVDRTDVALERQHGLRGAGTNVLAHEPAAKTEMAMTPRATRAVCMGSAAVRLHHARKNGAALRRPCQDEQAMTFLRRYGSVPAPRLRADRRRARADRCRRTTPPSSSSRCSPSCRSPRSSAARPRSLAEHLGGGIGGLLNATFGNAAELIIGALALREGLSTSSRPRSPGRSSATCCSSSAPSALVGGLQAPGPALQPHGRRPGHDDAAAQHDRAGRPGGVPPAGARRRQRRRAEARHRDRGRAVRRPTASA